MTEPRRHAAVALRPWWISQEHLVDGCPVWSPPAPGAEAERLVRELGRKQAEAAARGPERTSAGGAGTGFPGPLPRAATDAQTSGGGAGG